MTRPIAMAAEAGVDQQRVAEFLGRKVLRPLIAEQHAETDHRRDDPEHLGRGVQGVART